MATTRYIEISSAYRNRNLPGNELPAEFIIPIAQYGNHDRFTALDPVSDMAPITTFNGNFISTGGPTLTGTITAFGPGLGATSDIFEVILQSVAGTMVQLENYYDGAVVQNTTTNDRRRVIAYRFINSAGGFDRGLFSFASPFSTIAAGNTFSVSNPSDNSAPNAQIFIPFGELFKENFFVNMIITDETINENRTITFYDSSTSLATINTPFGGGWAITDSYAIRGLAPYDVGTLAASTINTFQLPAGFSTVLDFYTGSFIRITSGPASGNMRRITTYSDATVPSTVGTVFPRFTAVPGLAEFEILVFTRDNFVPFSYSGSIVSQDQNVAYEIELLDLILPNRVLSVDYGNRIVFHPYVELIFYNKNNPNNNIIYSNNPNNNRALFRCPIDDVPSPLVTSFVKIDGDGMVQTIKFKPNDDLYVRVQMPNGQLFQTVDDDWYSPVTPNPLIQISMCFAIRRIDP